MVLICNLVWNTILIYLYLKDTYIHARTFSPSLHNFFSHRPPIPSDIGTNCSFFVTILQWTEISGKSLQILTCSNLHMLSYNGQVYGGPTSANATQIHPPPRWIKRPHGTKTVPIKTMNPAVSPPNQRWLLGWQLLVWISAWRGCGMLGSSKEMD